MRPKRYSSEGIILARKNLGEADRILTVLSKKYGKVSLIGKGIRKLKSKKRGSLEVFSHVSLAAARGRSLDILTEVESVDNFSRIRESLRKTAVAYFFVETVDKLTKDEEKNEILFKLLLEYLKDLETSTALKKLRLEFVEEVLIHLGFWPMGKIMKGHDKVLESVTERKMGSVRVGKKITA